MKYRCYTAAYMLFNLPKCGHIKQGRKQGGGVCRPFSRGANALNRGQTNQSSATVIYQGRMKFKSKGRKGVGCTVHGNNIQTSSRQVQRYTHKHDTQWHEFQSVRGNRGRVDHLHSLIFNNRPLLRLTLQRIDRRHFSSRAPFPILR
jgi:hypothetical protein